MSSPAKPSRPPSTSSRSCWPESLHPIHLRLDVADGRILAMEVLEGRADLAEVVMATSFCLIKAFSCNSAVSSAEWTSTCSGSSTTAWRCNAFLGARVRLGSRPAEEACMLRFWRSVLSDTRRPAGGRASVKRAVVLLCGGHAESLNDSPEAATTGVDRTIVRSPGSSALPLATVLCNGYT